MGTDTGGLHKECPFEVIGMIFLDLEASMTWESRRQYVRKTILKDGRRISFKKCDEAIRRRALIPLLGAANTIPGLCVCIGIHKQISSLGVPLQALVSLQNDSTLRARWTAPSFARMTRMAHLISLFLAGIGRDGQSVTWISDEDEMFESQQKAEDTRRILAAFSSMHVRWKPNRLQMGTTKLDVGDRFEEDLTAIPDLAAGAFGEALSTLFVETGGQVTNSPRSTLNSGLSEKASLLMSWWEDDSHALSRLGIVFDRRSDGKFCVHRCGAFS